MRHQEGAGDAVTAPPATSLPDTIAPAGRAAGLGALSMAPGAIIAGRYRLVALLGRGGMGEVYRADDLTLGQPVALKFLPVDARATPDRLEQFHNELRMARQISHKNVCRLYDLGEWDGRHLLTMEYVDGEDLASLIRRIGRIPEDKAVQIARQLCAALAAAHDRGLLHRDLKPANVMLDGQGDVRMTDFGLAVPADATGVGHAGTPEYMAPEQLTGSPATTASDIYALGLILFEVFTGRRAHEATTLDELREFHKSGSIKTPTSVVRDLAPAVERIIMRCLERDPARRPRSPLAVAAALPGGNALAEALAAGETLSPELLAAAAEVDALPPLRGLALIAAGGAAVLACLTLIPALSVPGLVPLTRPPAVLLDRGDQLVAQLGYSSEYGARAYGTTVSTEYQSWLQREERDRWRDLLGSVPPASVVFWYRTSPQAFEPSGTSVTQTDPPDTGPGMRTLLFDATGRLLALQVVPPRTDAEAMRADGPDWEPLFAAAGLQRDAFSATTPQWVPSSYADSRAAWEGTYPGRDDLPIRVEAASFAGRPTWFQVTGPWRQAAAAGTLARSAARQRGLVVSLIFLFAMVLAAGLLARVNVVAGRADRRGARRLAAIVLCSGVGVWFAGTHQASIEAELVAFLKGASFSGLYAAVCWVLYLGLEPYARRYWPDGLLGWSRLLAGHLHDPRVGREVLIGLAVSGLFMAFNIANKATEIATTGGQPIALFGDSVESLAHGSLVLETWASAALDALVAGLLAALAYIGSRLLITRTAPAALASVALMSMIVNGGAVFSGGWTAVFVVLRVGILIVVTIHAGLLPVLVAATVSNLLSNVPMTLHAGAWHATSSNATLLLIASLAAFGYYAARGGQPLFGSLSAPGGVPDSRPA